MSYKAIVCKVKIREHPNADNLQLGAAAGHQVVIGLKVEDDTLGVFFPTDGKLSPEYCEANDLFPILDINGKRIGGGFFDRKKPRVRAQNFRGEKSDGYWAPIDSLSYTGIDTNVLVEGYEFDELNGKVVCEKYYTPATLNAMNSNSPSKKKNIMFAEHESTKQFRYGEEDLIVGSLVTITEKVHGTSGRYAHVLEDNSPKTMWKKIVRRFSPQADYKWSKLIGTRRVILQSSKDVQGGFYGSHEFRNNIGREFMNHLHKGEVIYGEIVGDVEAGSPIMAPHKIEKRDLNELKKTYGETMEYRYGCTNGEHQFYVYRITQVNEDGVVFELPWSQVKHRTEELGLKYVPQLGNQTILREDTKDLFIEAVETLTDGPSTLDPTHIREGVVVRVDKPDGTVKFLKSKSWTFGVLEGIIKSDDSYVDAEEIS